MWLIVHLFIIAALSVRVLLRPHRDPASRVAWILFIMAVPYLGALVYLMLGEVRPTGTWIQQRRPDSAQFLSANAAARDATIPEHAWPGFAIGASISGFAPVGGNKGHLLDDSNATIDALVADIDAATQHVHLLFYIWLADTNGRKVVDAIVRAAKRGVTCRVIVDDLGSRDFIRSEHWSAMSRAGVQLARAQLIGNILVRILKGRVDVRNHRKIVVIDNHITYCGSQNCADPEFAVKAKYAPWVDAVIRFEGPIARQNQQLFLTDWLISTHEDFRELAHQPMPQPEPGFVAQVIGTGPENHYSATPELFATLMFSARRELVITTPYYVPDDAMQAALCASARRGIPTTIVLPARNDSWFVGAASRSYYAELLGAGVCIHEYVGGLLHAKTLTIDGEMTLIGSANMDRRSFDLNFENNILFHDPQLTQTMRRRQETYIAQSKPVSKTDVAAWGLRLRLRNNIMAIFSPVL
ncbi:cardiolipin synthase [Pusillimonas sp. ANT_WB101]|uniref:cardiolipin synthase n=1 Tax=Pusillimonas sp. ANT_WB101 TaxID=2597356 RepID=UPI0011ED59FB|nr:cardiolipin synthase [Pusillimonas sp. ANT_WB101]KAA0893040.1 cardiolipin synthase [Pusillimonas sp. ANT_WB101]